METFITIDPVHQTGHNCKITALATAEQHFANSLNVSPIPLHKKDYSFFSAFYAPVSVRSIAKKKGSYQGEILEFSQWMQVVDCLGYKATIIDLKEKTNNFRQEIKNQLTQGNLIVACFAVDVNTGQPTTEYTSNRSNEHAAVICGFDEENDEIAILHWGGKYITSIEDFYHSSLALPEKRNPEYYTKIPWYYKGRKYELYETQDDSALKNSTTKKTITPSENSGFKGKLLIIEKPSFHALFNRNISLNFNHKMDLMKEFFTTPSLKRDFLIGFLFGLLALGLIAGTVATLGATVPALGISLTVLTSIPLATTISVGCAIPFGLGLSAIAGGELTKYANEEEEYGIQSGLSM